MHGKVCHMKMYHIIPSYTDQFSHRCSDNCHVQRWPKQPQSTAGWPKEPLISKMAQRATFNSWKCECEDIDIFLIPNRCVFVCLLYWWLIGSFCADSRSFACILFFGFFVALGAILMGAFSEADWEGKGHHLVKLQCTFGKTAMDFFRLFIKKNRVFSKQICLNLSYVRATLTCELLASKYSWILIFAGKISNRKSSAVIFFHSTFCSTNFSTKDFEANLPTGTLQQ